MMNSKLENDNTTTTPAWAFLFGWWFILLAIQEILPVALSLIEWFSFRNDQVSIPPTFFNTAWPLLYSFILIAGGFILLRTQKKWKWIVLSVCIFMLVDMILSDFILRGGLHWLLSPVAGPDWCGVILPPVRVLLFSSLMIYFSCRKQEPDHSIFAPVTIFLIVAGFSAMIKPLDTLEFQIHIALSYRESIWEMMALGLWKIALKILAPILVILSTLLIRKHPKRIRKIAAAFWIIGLLFAINETGPVWSTLQSTPLTNLNYLAALAISQYRLPPAFAMLIPSIITTLLALRYMVLFRAADNSIPNAVLCPHCGYNLTGNTSGQCPECGNTIQEHLLTVLQQTPDKS